MVLTTLPVPFPISQITHQTGRPITDGLMFLNRLHPIAFGQRHWNGISGYLFLAPPEELGGDFGNHLVFFWESNGTNYVFSLHGWEPLTRAAATLHSLIDMIQPAQPRDSPPLAACHAIAG